MAKRKKDPSTVGLSSPEVKGQGTTNIETDGTSASTARKKNKK